MNMYAYVANDPINGTDPTGKWGWLIVRGAQWAAKKCAGNAACRGAAVKAGRTIKRGVDRIRGRDRVEPSRRDGPDKPSQQERRSAFPDRKLPRDKDGRPQPHTDRPHSQLGRREGRNGEYDQAREFGENGEVKRDIDFTDHGRPDTHPNPHQHRTEPNPTGGTPRRSRTPERLEDPD